MRRYVYFVSYVAFEGSRAGWLRRPQTAIRTVGNVEVIMDEPIRSMSDLQSAMEMVRVRERLSTMPIALSLFPLRVEGDE